MKNLFPTVLSINGGFVDTASFLALHGLFTGHVTGNIITLAAGVATGQTGSLSKVLALPVYCAVVVVITLLVHPLRRRQGPVHMRALMTLQLALITAGT